MKELTFITKNAENDDEISDYWEDQALSIACFKNTPTDTFTWTINLGDEPNTKFVEHFLKLFENIVTNATICELEDVDWLAQNRKDFVPVFVGSFAILREHHGPTPDMPPHQIVLEAATAFGSGTHATTQGCLHFIDKLTPPAPNASLLDLGCGSGILALAMARKWKQAVYAADFDPESVRVTQENAINNDLADFIQPFVSKGFDGLVGHTWDIIVANILAGPLCELAPECATTLKPNGILILSGLLESQAEKLLYAYHKFEINLVDQITLEGWTTLLLRKHDNGDESHQEMDSFKKGV